MTPSGGFGSASQLTYGFRHLPTGFTWQDDYTQHVLAQELSYLPRTHLWCPRTAHPAR